MKKILVTGGLGFIGSNFIRFLLKRYPDLHLVNLDKETYSGNRENLADLEKNPHYTFIQGEICDPKTVERTMKGCTALFNFAAQTHVDRSILKAEDFVMTNIVGTHVLLEAAKKYSLNRFIHVSCYDEQTRAVTPEGLKTYKELKEGDLVFSLNPVTKEIELKPIEKVIIQPYEGEMIHFKNKRVDLCVTPNHNMFILDTTKKRLLVETAEEVSKRSIFYLPEVYWRGKKEEYIDLKDYGRVKTKDLMYLLGIFIGDGFIAYQEKKRETMTGLPRSEYLEKARDEQSGEFKTIEKLGNHVTTCHSYRMFLDIPESDKCRKRVKETLSRLGIDYRCHSGKAGTHLYFSSKTLMDFFAQCGQGAHHKRIPQWALDYSPEYLTSLLEGLMDSDGHNGKIYHTVSEKLVSDVCELCIKLNLKPSIHSRHTASSLNGRKIEGKSYYVFVANTAKSISRHRNKRVNYKGNIWCLKVKDNKNFLVERNGRFDFCGNTDEVYGSIEKGVFNEESPLNPSSPYSATKAAADLLILAYHKTYKLPVVITRCTNNFGPYQYPEKLVSLFITNAIEDRTLPLYGDGLNVREWIYVLDHCEALDTVWKKGKEGEIYNVGTGEQISNKVMTLAILKILGKPESLVDFVKDRPGHDRRYAVDATKIRSLGWQPRHSFVDALKETVQWYQSHEAWWQRLKKKRKDFQEYYQIQYGERG